MHLLQRVSISYFYIFWKWKAPELILSILKKKMLPHFALWTETHLPLNTEQIKEPEEQTQYSENEINWVYLPQNFINKVCSTTDSSLVKVPLALVPNRDHLKIHYNLHSKSL